MASTLFITNHAIQKMQGLGISEATINDVFNHGSQVKENMMVKKFNGYEVGLVFGKHFQTKQYMIISVWKRDRR